MIYLTLLILFLGLFQFHCKEEEDCVNRKLRECSDKYKINLQFYPTTIDDLKEYCRTIEQNDECFKTSWTECISMKTERDAIVGRMNTFSSPHYRDLCNLNSTYSRLFVKHGKCLNQTVLGQNKCQNKYRLMTQPRETILTAVGLFNNVTRAQRIEKIRQICCWWSEYQSCTVKAVIKPCGEEAAILVNEEFYKAFTSSSTSKILTYNSCLPQDKTYRYPACFLNKSVDPNSLGLTFVDNELDVEDDSRRKEIQGIVTPEATQMVPFELNVEEVISKSVSVKSKIYLSIVLIVLSLLTNF